MNLENWLKIIFNVIKRRWGGVRTGKKKSEEKKYVCLFWEKSLKGKNGSVLSKKIKAQVPSAWLLDPLFYVS